MAAGKYVASARVRRDPGASGWAQEPAHGTAKAGSFGEAKRGDVPSGTLEMMTTETDQAIQAGLAWLARTRKRGWIVWQFDVPRQHCRHERGRVGVHVVGIEPGTRALRGAD